MFDSSGLNLIFEELLLRVSRRRHTKGWQQQPPRVGPEHAEDANKAFDHPASMPLCFYRETVSSEVPEPVTQRGGNNSTHELVLNM
jgi:hypothetical protein